jgi:hypothetical protein
MATDYMPVFVPGRIVTLTTSGLVAAGDALVVSGNGTVAKAGAGAVNVIGVAAQDTASGSKVTVYGRGTVHESVNEGGVTAGDQLVSSGVAGKQVKTAAVINITGVPPVVADINAAFALARAVIGVALTSAADNTKCRWMEF